MTHEARQLQLMREVLRFVPDEHREESIDALLLLIADVYGDAKTKYQIDIERVSE